MTSRIRRVLSRLTTVAIHAYLIGMAIVVQARESSDPVKVGIVSCTSTEVSKPFRDALKDGLEKLGYVEGRNISFVPRYSNGDSSRYPDMVRDLIALKVDVLVACPVAVEPVLNVTKTVPVVCPTLWNPVGNRVVNSFARPGGNLTGMFALSAETDAKLLQFMKEVMPGLKTAAFLTESDHDSMSDAMTLRSVAEGSGITLRIYVVTDAVDLERALSELTKDPPQALIIPTSPFFLLHRDRVMHILSSKIPVFAESRDFAEVGALLSYSANFIEMWRRSSTIVDRILKGVKAGDIPIEQAMTFDLVVNLRAAKRLGIRVPDSVLVGADVIR